MKKNAADRQDEWPRSCARGHYKAGYAAKGMPGPEPLNFTTTKPLTPRCIFLWNTLLRPAAVAPRSVARGASQDGDRAAEGMPRPHICTRGAPASRYGSHLPSEDTAPPCAVTPPASVAFVRPIPRYSGTHGAYSESLEKVPRKRPLSIRRRNAISCATFAALPVESVALARGSDRVLRRVAPVSGFRNR
jgi:hypothetical protein